MRSDCQLEQIVSVDESSGEDSGVRRDNPEGFRIDELDWTDARLAGRTFLADDAPRLAEHSMCIRADIRCRVVPKREAVIRPGWVGLPDPGLPGPDSTIAACCADTILVCTRENRAGSNEFQRASPTRSRRECSDEGVGRR